MRRVRLQARRADSGRRRGARPRLGLNGCRGRVSSAARRRRSRTPPRRIRPAGDGLAVATTAACPVNRKHAPVSQPPIEDGARNAFISPLPRQQRTGRCDTCHSRRASQRLRPRFSFVGELSEPTTCGRLAEGETGSRACFPGRRRRTVYESPDRVFDNRSQRCSLGAPAPHAATSIGRPNAAEFPLPARSENR